MLSAEGLGWVRALGCGNFLGAVRAPGCVRSCAGARFSSCAERSTFGSPKAVRTGAAAAMTAATVAVPTIHREWLTNLTPRLRGTVTDRRHAFDAPSRTAEPRYLVLTRIVAGTVAGRQRRSDTDASRPCHIQAHPGTAVSLAPDKRCHGMPALPVLPRSLSRCGGSSRTPGRARGPNA